MGKTQVEERERKGLGEANNRQIGRQTNARGTGRQTEGKTVRSYRHMHNSGADIGQTKTDEETKKQRNTYTKTRRVKNCGERPEREATERERRGRGGGHRQTDRQRQADRHRQTDRQRQVGRHRQTDRETHKDKKC